MLTRRIASVDFRTAGIGIAARVSVKILVFAGADQQARAIGLASDVRVVPLDWLSLNDSAAADGDDDFQIIAMLQQAVKPLRSTIRHCIRLPAVCR